MKIMINYYNWFFKLLMFWKFLKKLVIFGFVKQVEGAQTSGDDSVYDDNFMMSLLQELSQIGEVILVRFVEETMWVTFRDGQCAVVAAKRATTQVRNIVFFVFCVIWNLHGTEKSAQFYMVLLYFVEEARLRHTIASSCGAIKWLSSSICQWPFS